MSRDRQRAPARVRQSAPAEDVPGATRTIPTSRGPVTVGAERHELPREDVYRAYHGGILFDPVEIGGT